MKLPVWFLNFDFGGRARRSHYWANLGAWLAMSVVFLIVASIISGSASPEKAGSITGPLLPLYWLMIQDSDQGPNKYGPPVKQFYVPPAPVATQ